MTIQDTFKVAKRTKVNLADYDYERDIKNRLILFSLSKTEVAVLEEILFSPIQFSLTSLESNLDLPPLELHEILEKLSSLDLFTRNHASITVDKERRKYFEVQIARFSEDFKTDLEFFQSLLKTLPIQLLPIWYQIPRTSNNIFLSLIERHLQTPQIYNRHLIDFVSGNDLATQIVNDLFASPEGKLPFSSIMEKYGLSRIELEEIVLYLEFNILAFLSPQAEGEQYELYLCSLEEWKNYKASLQCKHISRLPETAPIEPFRKEEYAFIEDMGRILRLSFKEGLEIEKKLGEEKWNFTPYSKRLLAELFPSSLEGNYFERIIAKLIVLGLAQVEESRLKPTGTANEWLDIPLEQRAHITFKHPHNYDKNHLLSLDLSQRAVVEIEKSLNMIQDGGWVFFDDFLECAEIALHENRQVKLEKVGRVWSYKQPAYSEEELEFIRYTILTWFFESGIVRIGMLENKPCFCLTTLGKKLSSW